MITQLQARIGYTHPGPKVRARRSIAPLPLLVQIEEHDLVIGIRVG